MTDNQEGKVDLSYNTKAAFVFASLRSLSPREADAVCESFLGIHLKERSILRQQVAELREALKIYANEARWSNAIIVNVEEKLQGVATFQMLHGKSFEFAQEALRRCDEIGEEKK